MPHVRKRGKKTWSVVLDVGPDPSTGKRRQKWFTIKGTKREAERFGNDVLKALAEGAYVEPTRFTVGQWLTGWLDGYVKMQTDDGTQESYRYLIERHLIPGLGGIHLCQSIRAHQSRRLDHQFTIHQWCAGPTGRRVDGHDAVAPLRIYPGQSLP